MSNKAKSISIGLLIGFLPTIGVAWAFAVTAADHVMAPHLADAKARVHLMCQWAKVQSENTRAICEATGAKCQTFSADVLVQSGCEEDGR